MWKWIYFLFIREFMAGMLPFMCVTLTEWDSIEVKLWSWDSINSSPPGWNGSHFADNIFKCIFYENVRISLMISQKFVLKVLINSIWTLLQMRAWRRLGHKLLSGTLMVSLLTNICIIGLNGLIRPLWYMPPPMATITCAEFHWTM